MDNTAFNYNSEANTDDGSCEPFIYGCIDSSAFNYNPEANTDDGSCIPIIYGCMDDGDSVDYDGDGMAALNYNANANTDDGSCISVIYGCTDPEAFNYNLEANMDNGTCVDIVYGCTDPEAFSGYNPDANVDDGSCVEVVYGCTYDNALNYNPNANMDDGSCQYAGCTDQSADNYDPNASVDDGSCFIVGCAIDAWYICPESYNPNATINDWSACVFIWDGCASTSLDVISPDEYPLMQLTDVTDDIVDAYYYLGMDRIGCMDKSAHNYLSSAVLDDGSCLYSMNMRDNIVKDNIIIYPQPAQNRLYVSINNLIDYSNVLEIRNVIGETVLSKQINIYMNPIELNISNLNTGIYYLMLEVDKEIVTKRLIIE